MTERIDPSSMVLVPDPCKRHQRAMARELRPGDHWPEAIALFSVACWHYTSGKDDGAIWDDVPKTDSGGPDFRVLNAKLDAIGCLGCHIGERMAVRSRAEVVSVIRRNYLAAPPWLPDHMKNGGSRAS